MSRVITAFFIASSAAALCACAVGPADESSGEETAEASSALSGTLTLKNVATGLCADSNTSGDDYALGCNGGSFQKWTVISRSSTVVSLKDLATGLCLDSNTNGDSYTLGCNGGNFQNWTVISRGGTVISLKDVSTGFCLDSSGSGDLHTQGCNGGNFQNWSH